LWQSIRKLISGILVILFSLSREGSNALSKVTVYATTLQAVNA
jgi:hypothetical protein